MTSLFSTSELSFVSVPLSTSSSTPATSVDPLLRADGRQPLAYRDIVLATNVSQAQGALGSAKVQISSIGGETEIWAGVRGEVEDVTDSEEEQQHERGDQGGRIVVSIECAPTALPSLRPDVLLHLSALLTSLFSPSSLPASLLSQLVVLPSSKAWVLYLDVLILSSLGGNVLDLAIIAARSALAATRIPVTKSVGYEPEVGDKEGVGIEDAGISGLVKGGKAGVNAVDFELVDGGWDAGERLTAWEELPVALTMNMINQLPHLDGTTLEEAATSSQVVFSFTSKGDICNIKQIGEGEIEFARLMPLLSEAKRISSDLIAALNAKLKDA